MKRLSMPIVSLLVAFAAGCGVGPHVDDFNESLVAKELAECGCTPNEEECREDAPPTAGEQACVEALFKNAEGNYEAQLDCLTAANNRLAGCLNGKACTDLARLGCGVDALDDIEDCPDLPNDIANELRQCLD